MKAELCYITSREFDYEEWKKELIGISLIAETNEEYKALERFVNKGIKTDSKIGILSGLDLYFNDLSFRPRKFE